MHVDMVVRKFNVVKMTMWIMIILLMFNLGCSKVNGETETRPIPTVATFGSLISTMATGNGHQNMCQPGQYRCWDGTCIQASEFCDDVYDCPDNSDEVDYHLLKQQVKSNVMASIVPCITPASRQKHNRRARPCALWNTWVCDGIKGQCVEDNDEVCWSAPSSECSSIALNLRCNGYVDCHDGSDEANCSTYYCSNSENTSYTPLVKGQLCDGKFDCMDASDECVKNCKSECYCPRVYEIGNNNVLREVKDPEHCISCQDRLWMYKLSELCDGTIDCEDGSDEINCTDFQCKNGKVILEALRCDTKDDCGDTSDECDCPNTFKCNNSYCIPMSKTCNGVNDCGDHSDECIGDCESKNRFICETGQCISAKSFCDGEVDCTDGSDERMTSYSAQTPIYCNNTRNNANKTCVLEQETWLCDMSDHCVDRADECRPECSALSFWCDNARCLKVEDFCNGVTDCDDGTDELPYNPSTSSDAVRCVSKFHTEYECALNVTHPWVCDVLTHCLNRTDECVQGCSSSYQCESGECIDRSRLCNGEIDCVDGSDEHTTSGQVFECVRTRHPITRTCLLPLSITKDNISDCDRNMDMIDHHVMEVKSNEEEVPTSVPDRMAHTFFNCIGEPRVIPGESQCDKIFNCPLLSDECMCEDSPKICDDICYDKSSPPDGSRSPCSSCDVGEIKCDDKCIDRIQVCDGVRDCSSGVDEEFCQPKTKCHSGEGEQCISGFKCWSGLGEQGNAYPCDGRPQCINLEDECSDECHDIKGSLPEYCFHISNLNMLFSYSRRYYGCNEGGIFLKGPQICDGLSRDCPGGEDEIMCPGRVYCNDTESEVAQKGAIHIDISQICDGKIDCSNKKDERNCTEHYYCDNGEPYFVPLRAVMDGKADCSDGSDECPQNSFNGSVFSSRELMIRDSFLRYIIWVMGGLAISGNLAVLLETVHGLLWSDDRFKNKRPFAKVNHVLVINLALADLLMGLYLIILGSEAAARSGSYCLDDKSWRSSATCNFLGVLTVVSSVTSVLILLILTSYRLYGVINPFKCRDINHMVALGFAGVAWMTSLILAMLPVTTFSYHYKSDAWIKHNTYFKHDVVTRKALFEFVRKIPLFYNHDMGNNSIQQGSVDDSWDSMKAAMTARFGKDAIRGEFGYYSHVSLCMPKLYVTTDDVAWEHSMIIIIFNCVAFTYIIAAYAYIFFRSVTSMKTKSSKRQRSMFRRISYLVASDLACWLPICVMAFMNFAGYKIPENAYAISAVILLPINSAVNPLLYSNAVQRVIISAITCGKREKDSLQTSMRAPESRDQLRTRSTPGSMETSFKKKRDQRMDEELEELHGRVTDEANHALGDDAGKKIILGTSPTKITSTF